MSRRHGNPGAMRMLPLLLLLATGCGSRTAQPPVSRSWASMSTFATLSVPHAQRHQIDSAAGMARTILDEIEDEFSVFRPESLTARLNATAGDTSPLPLSPRADALFAMIDHVVQRSAAAFDPTIGPLMEVWGLRGKPPVQALPDPDRLRQTMEQVGWHRVALRDGTARLTRPGMRLDFGGIAKGYAVDLAFERLQEAGWSDLMVNLAGNLRCAGSARPNHPGWRIAVRDPFRPYGEGSVGTLVLTHGRATATSGAYERYVEIDGRRVSHILDPRNGHPVSGLAQVTVVADSAAEADALSTALFVLGPEEGAARLRAFPGATALFILDREGDEPPELWATPGFDAVFTPAEAWKAHLRTLPAPRLAHERLLQNPSSDNGSAQPRPPDV